MSFLSHIHLFLETRFLSDLEITGYTLLGGCILLSLSPQCWLSSGLHTHNKETTTRSPVFSVTQVGLRTLELTKALEIAKGEDTV